MVEMYKILRGKYDSAVTSDFITLRENESITRGHNLKIIKERCRLNIIKKELIYRNTYIWNSVPQYVVKVLSVKSFDKLWNKYQIKTYILLLHLLYGLCHLLTQPRSLNTTLKTELAQQAGMPNTRQKWAYTKLWYCWVLAGS